MSQGFTVELEWRPVYQATVHVLATDIADARLKALEKAGADRTVWDVAVTGSGAPFVLKITAHAGEPVEPPPFGSTEMWRLARKHRRSK